MKKLISLVAFITLYLSCAKGVSASLVVIDDGGNLNWNVLSYETSVALNVPDNGEIKVSEIADKSLDEKPIVYLKKDGEKVSLKQQGGRELDVTNWKDSVVEIEERDDAKKLLISINNGKFGLEQENVKAETEFPIKIDAKENKISLETPTGEKFLAILPSEAAQSFLRTKMASEVDSKTLEIVEQEKDISYVIKGIKMINLFNIYNLKVPVSANISASTGEIVNINPSWLGVVNYLLI